MDRSAGWPKPGTSFKALEIKTAASMRVILSLGAKRSPLPLTSPALVIAAIYGLAQAAISLASLYFALNTALFSVSLKNVIVGYRWVSPGASPRILSLIH